MKRFALIALASLFSLSGAFATTLRAEPAKTLAFANPSPPAAGVVPIGVTVIEMQAVVLGWSVKKDLLGKNVQNDKKQNLGKIEDIIITPRNSASFAIIGVGGFLGIAAKLVAIPMAQIKLESGQLVLPRATKDNLKAMPPFVYAH